MRAYALAGVRAFVRAFVLVCSHACVCGVFGCTGPQRGRNETHALARTYATPGPHCCRGRMNWARRCTLVLWTLAAFARSRPFYPAETFGRPRVDPWTTFSVGPSEGPHFHARWDRRHSLRADAEQFCKSNGLNCSGSQIFDHLVRDWSWGYEACGHLSNPLICDAEVVASGQLPQEMPAAWKHAANTLPRVERGPFLCAYELLAFALATVCLMVPINEPPSSGQAGAPRRFG